MFIYISVYLYFPTVVGSAGCTCVNISILTGKNIVNSRYIVAYIIALDAGEVVWWVVNKLNVSL